MKGRGLIAHYEMNRERISAHWSASGSYTIVVTACGRKLDGDAQVFTERGQVNCLQCLRAIAPCSDPGCAVCGLSPCYRTHA